MKTKQLHLIWTAVIACALLASAGWGGIWLYASQHTVPKQVSVVVAGSKTLAGGAVLPIGTMSAEEAKQVLTSREQALERLSITIKGGPAGKGQVKTWTLAELGLSVDTKAAIAAIDRLGSGDLWAKAKYRWGFPRQLTIGVSFDKAVFAGKVRSQWGWMDAGEPVNAKRKITAQDKVVYTPHKDAYRLDTEGMYASAVEAIGRVVGGDWGTAPAGMTWPVKLRVVHPAVTLQRLKDEGVDRLITSFTTEFKTSGEGRAYNVTVTAKTLNDWDLAPGEVFDYSKIISLTNEKYGFREAPVILNGEFVPGIGGGICQVSSTLYNAALLAGLDMVERRNHSLPVAYLPLGRDATFADDAINFRFKNTTGKHIIIRTAVKDRELTVKLFGTLPKNVKYSLESKIVATVVPPLKEVAKENVSQGSRRLIAEGKPGYIVETFRIKLEDGKQVSRSRISRDSYKAQPVIYAVSKEDLAGGHGSGSGDEQQEQLLEDGVVH
ncbi:VanW family protein [Paenibacillus silvisoli]|uniref:VanW family protein n=1 Tax=Paenibacillus silvisoli TaxID=3110539 RepID=UPI00280465D2|nr:VanW family protein [Paenibacillus silvisoli]